MWLICFKWLKICNKSTLPSEIMSQVDSIRILAVLEKEKITCPSSTQELTVTCSPSQITITDAQQEVLPPNLSHQTRTLTSRHHSSTKKLPIITIWFVKSQSTPLVFKRKPPPLPWVVTATSRLSRKEKVLTSSLAKTWRAGPSQLWANKLLSIRKGLRPSKESEGTAEETSMSSLSWINSRLK
jgi:hypothetical protein